MKTVKKRVPVVMQMEVLECGAASLSMVLAYHGKWVTLPELRERVGVSRDGVNALSIVKAARSYGLEAKGYRWGIAKLKEEAQLPCVLFWRNCHFVVLTGMTEKHALINDPALGSVRVPWGEFEESYSGVCLQFSPGAEFERGGRPTSVLSFARERLAGSGAALAFLSLMGFAAAGLSVIQPTLSSSFIDKILSGANPSWLGPLLAALVVLAVVQAALLASNASYQLCVQGRFSVSSNVAYVNHVLRLPLLFFSQRTAGDLYNRQKSNAGVAQSLMATLVPVGVGVITMLAYLAMMLSISPTLALISVTAVLLDLAVAQVTSRMRVRIGRQVARDSGNLAGTTANILNVMETVKAGGAEEGVFNQWAGAQAAVLAGQARTARVNAYWGTLPKVILDISNALLLALGALFIMQGELTSGMLLALQSFTQQFINPAQQLINAGQKVVEMRTDMERIEDVTNYPKDPLFDREGEDLLREPLTGSVSIKDVTFGYSPLGAPLLSDFSLELTPGRKVALVGGSGCGKSTVAKLVAGLYHPWSGQILFDGRPIEDYDRDVFTSCVGVVDQDIFLFSGTVKDAFRFADGTITEAAMIAAAQDAQVHEAILKHPGGYNATIAEGGRNFSGGQRQQLEIARVLAGNPRILVLDEATSALDAQTEARVMDAIRRRGVTTIMVAHRLSTIRDADEILVLDRGRVVERGTHDELMALNGAYVRLVTAG